MVQCGEVFREIVTVVFGSGFPINDELVLRDVVAYPVEAHVHVVGLALFEGIVCNARGSGVVGFDWHGWLGVSKFFKG
jgi:hypothetical protein